jgi:chemotaxis protein CheD
MADLAAAKDPVMLTTLGLGSCVGIALFDPFAKVVGLAHCMLPDSKQIQNNGNHAKFVDTAIIKLVMEMARLGARKDAMKAKIAGGAQMFAFSSANDIMRIGDRNVAATAKILSLLGIPIVARETGDTFGRTVELYSSDNRLVVKTIGHGIRTL